VKKKDQQSGQLIILVAVFMMVILTLVIGLVGYASVQIRSERQAVGRVQGLNIAEGGIEKALYKLNNPSSYPAYSGETGTALGAGTYNITITTVNSITKIIKADAFVPNQSNAVAKRTVQIKVILDAANIAFNYGVQVGNGGLKMDNNARINGNVYANGDIIGDNNGVRIAGTAIAAGATGKIDEVDDIDNDATAHFLEDVSVDGSTNSYDLLRGTVGGNVVATTITNCTIGGNATYDTKTNPCTIGGTQTTPNPADFVDPVIQALPISDEQIENWEQEAENGGDIGTQTVDGALSLGPKKISGNLILNNNSVLTVTGTIWATGQIILNQGSTIKLSSDYGGLSGVVLAGTLGSSSAGYIDAQNGSIILGSGTAGSYLMLLSQRNSATELAINVANTAAGAIFYAGYGLIDVSNIATAKELTAYKIHLNQNAVITYESGLADAQFSSGPGAGWAIADGTWQLLQ
jgi:Tfp pilus assembly protein PilX